MKRSRLLLAACAVALVGPAVAGCASKNVPADRIVYVVGGDVPPPMLPATSASAAPSVAPVPAGPAPVQRADEAKVREWWAAHRPAQGYIPEFDTAATEAAWQQAQCASSCGWP